MDVSVVITTMGDRAYLTDAVRSVLMQERPVREVVVVLDGAADESLQSRIESLDETRVRVVAMGENRGQAMAQNRGIAETSGAWVAFLDDDDMWHPEKVAACAALVESDPEVMAIWHQQCYVISPAYAEWHPGKANTCVLADSLEQAIEGLASRSGDRLTLVPGALPPHLERLGDSRLALLGRMQGGMSAAVVRRDCVITAGCFEPHAKNQDWLFYLNVSRLSPWIEIDRPLGFTRLHDDQDSWGSDYLMPVSARHFVWFGNRPMPGRVTDEERRQLLAKLGPEYRGLISQMLWAAVRGGRYSMAAGVLSMGLPLLPRWRDRMAVVTPRPIAHRLGWL